MQPGIYVRSRVIAHQDLQEGFASKRASCFRWQVVSQRFVLLPHEAAGGGHTFTDAIVFGIVQRQQVAQFRREAALYIIVNQSLLILLLRFVAAAVECMQGSSRNR